MRCLVTGGAGFIGSSLVDRLIEQGHEVVVWDALTTGKRENVNPAALFDEVHVSMIKPDFVSGKVDVIFHLAGEARIQPSFLNPSLVHTSNVTGTLRVLEYASVAGARVVYAGSSSVYHDQYANPYTFSKHVAEEYCTMYNRIYKVPVALARFFNVYGPRQLEEGAYATVIGVFERQKREGRPLTITGDGEQRRDFTHVSDIVDGLIGMSKDKWDAKVFNLGTGTNHSINEIAAMFKHPFEYVPARPGEARNTLADISESYHKFGYKPKRDLKQYIESLS
jgi:UDP-glucose 4-epimerase